MAGEVHTPAGLLEAVVPWVERPGRSWSWLPAAAGEWHVDLPLDEVGPAVIGLIQAGARWSTLVASDERAARGDYGLAYVLSLPAAHAQLVLRARVPADSPSFPSVAASVPAADWAEREVQDLFGLYADGHPDGRRLMLFPEWPDGVYPMRADFDPADAVPVGGAPSFR